QANAPPVASPVSGSCAGCQRRGCRMGAGANRNYPYAWGVPPGMCQCDCHD
ncbi:unnamed protein product, partial [Didymodactylos carnosus]